MSLLQYHWQYRNKNAARWNPHGVTARLWKALNEWLGYRDSNPNYLIQSQASYH